MGESRGLGMLAPKAPENEIISVPGLPPTMTRPRRCRLSRAPGGRWRLLGEPLKLCRSQPHAELYRGEHRPPARVSSPSLEACKGWTGEHPGEFLDRIPCQMEALVAPPHPQALTLTHIDGPASLHSQLTRLRDKHRVKGSPVLPSLTHPTNTGAASSGGGGGELWAGLSRRHPPQ